MHIQKYICIQQAKLWTAINILSVIWRPDLSNKLKRNFFHVVVVSILLYGCTTWTLTKHVEERLNVNCKRMLRAILNKSRKQHLTKQQLYGQLPPISKTIQIGWTRHVGHCWRSNDELIIDIFLWTPSYSCVSVGQPARTYLQQQCTDTGCSL